MVCLHLTEVFRLCRPDVAGVRIVLGGRGTSRYARTQVVG